MTRPDNMGADGSGWAKIVDDLAQLCARTIDCATSSAPAHLPRPCDCSFAAGGTNVDRLAINLRAYAHSRGAPEREDDQEVAYEAAGDLIKAFAALPTPPAGETK